MMSATLLLRLRVSERLEAAVEEIFGLVEKTVSECQEEAVRSKREILQLRKQIEQLTVLKPTVVLYCADAQPVPALPVLEEMEIQEQLEQKEAYECFSPEPEADSSNNGESEPVPSELLKCSTAETLSVNQSMKEEGNKRDGSPLPSQSHSAEVFKELHPPPRDQTYCRLCGERFTRDVHLRKHVEESHKGNKAFKCLECNKEFDQRHHLIMHIRIHTGEKPFACDHCDKSFVQNSTRVVHMRLHTGEKPYYCNNCEKSYHTSNHFKLCEMRKKRKMAKEKRNVGKVNKNKEFKCLECNKEFNLKHQLVMHTKVHSDEKPFSCNVCDRTFRYKFNCLSHMRRHTEKKTFICDKCGKNFVCSKHLALCTGTEKKSTDRSIRCSTCGRTFYTDADLKVHVQVHESWKLHITEKQQGQNLEEKS
ncbi:oocyte zinc finger protein XlCOF20-like isoform X2 [Pseudochaenichthys georgianus]|uniref:oocyte zinc finger protein XlCOF20-like isoform X2 n=1 Tax=Pseudochaenichthys georgianus TaxID=52239 RepID=UPI00146C6399|nr:zinc finger protein 501-like isoform X2 [Pseudochaenichthys georgianus]